jgi:hypothetical protein
VPGRLECSLGERSLLQDSEKGIYKPRIGHTNGKFCGVMQLTQNGNVAGHAENRDKDSEKGKR